MSDANNTSTTGTEQFDPEARDPEDMEMLPFDYNYDHHLTGWADDYHEQRAIQLGKRRQWERAYYHASCIHNRQRKRALRDKLTIYKNGSQRGEFHA